MDLREQIVRALRKVATRPEACADAVMAVVQPALDAKDAALDTYTTDVLAVLQAKNEALERAERRIDRQVRRGDRLTEQVRDVRLLAEHWAKLAEPGDWGDNIPDTITADLGRDVLKVLDQPGDQEGTTP